MKAVINTVQNEKNYSALYPWFVWFLGVMFFFSEYVVRVSPSVMAQQLTQDFHLDAYELGILSSWFYYAYVAMQIPVGTLVDRYNIKLLLGSMCLLCAGSCFLFASTNSFTLVEFSRFVIGISGAFAFVGALKLASIWFPSNRFGFLAGATQAMGMLGATVGTGPVSFVVNHIGWRHTQHLFAIFLVVLAILIYRYVKQRPHTENTFTMISKVDFKQIGVVFRNRYIWLNGLFVGLLYAPTAAFGELWGPTYINKVYGISPVEAASVISCLFVGWAIGGPIIGWISDRIQRRKITMQASALLSLVFLSLLLYSPIKSSGFLFVVAFLYGISNVGVSISYAVSSEFVPKHWSGTALGFTNMASIMLGALLQPIFGKMLVWISSTQQRSDLLSYSVNDFRIVMLTLPILLILCFFISLFIKESYGGIGESE